jgi:acetyl esterase/lipase
VLTPGIQYGDGATTSGTIPLFLDLYRPSQTCATPRPTAVFVHGGGFTGGSRQGANVEAIARELAPLGINLMSIQYRLQGNSPRIAPEFAAFEADYQAIITGLPPERITAFVAAVEDTVRSLRWLQSNAAQNCIDPNRIALWGSSAGAITILHVAYALDAYGIQRPAPRVVVDYWGSLFRNTDLKANAPPLFVLHGTADVTVPYASALSLTSRAADVGVPFTFYSVVGGGHDFQGSGFFDVTVEGQSMAKRTADFVAAHLIDGRTPLYESRQIPR